MNHVPGYNFSTVGTGSGSKDFVNPLGNKSQNSNQTEHNQNEQQSEHKNQGGQNSQGEQGSKNRQNQKDSNINKSAS